MTSNLDVRSFVRLVFLAQGGRIEGRTKLQKTVYFVGLLTDQLDDLGYRPHYYGPYSPAVADAVDTDRSLGFLDQETLVIGSDARGFERARYDYRLTDDGESIAKKYSTQRSDIYQKIERACRTLQSAGAIDYMEMSIAAKTVHILKASGQPLTESAIKSTAQEFGWKLEEKDILEAGAYLKKLNLVQ